eukprot:scaffold22514_cov62-Phaeocystis_antarctica.AAC.3
MPQAALSLGRPRRISRVEAGSALGLPWPATRASGGPHTGLTRLARADTGLRRASGGPCFRPHGPLPTRPDEAWSALARLGLP